MLQKFAVRNLDCAGCALKVEKALIRTPGVKAASLDFSTLTLRIDADDLDLALDVIRSIEPDIEVVVMDGASRRNFDLKHADPWITGHEKIRLLAAFGLFACLIAMHYGWDQNRLIGVSYGIAIFAYLLAGWDVLEKAVRTLSNRDYFDEHVLMLIATMGAMAIGAASEAVAVMLFYKAGELLQNRAVASSRGAIRALLAARPDSAAVFVNGEIRRMPPERVRAGETIRIRPGEKVPLDGKVLSGNSLMDTSALTGESIPVSVRPGDTVMAGEINKTGLLSVAVTRPFASSSIVRMLDLVENAASQKAKTENFITTFSRYYTPAVVAAAAGIAFIPPLLIPGALFATWIYRALVLLVISCPCALVISIPLSYFGGIGRASKQGILIKGSNFIDVLAKVKTVVFDKTGTLTEGVFEVREVVPKNGYTTSRLLEYAAIAEYHSSHPIARSIQDACARQGIGVDPDCIGEYTEATGKGVRVVTDERTVLAGSADFMKENGVGRHAGPLAGTIVHVAIDGTHIGYLLIGDRIRPDTLAAFEALRDSGVEQIVMLTGDNQTAADTVAMRLNLDAYVAGLLPEQKVAEFEKILADRKISGAVAFVGDGINDAPVLARADVGVAMGAFGSDAAIEVADVVLMSDSPAKMAEAVAIGHHTRKIVWQNIILALSVKGLFLALGAMGLATMWEAVFADVGTAVVAVLNSTRALRL